MKTLPHNNWATWLEDSDRQRQAGRYNPAREISYKIPSMFCHQTVTIGAGTSDELDVFYEGSRLYVLSTNHSLEYIGLEVFEEDDKITSTFCDSSTPNIEYLLGLSSIWAAKRMANWIDA